METWSALPSLKISSSSRIGSAFAMRGVTDIRAAGRFLYELPYGRNTERSDFMLVLLEARGTCSTKHGLLAALAREQGAPLSLMLGVYEMSEANTPGVGAVLARNGLNSIPEAHCYVVWEGTSIDVTRSGVEPSEPIGRFLQEEMIAPEQIGEYKVAWHEAFIRDWANEGKDGSGLTFEQLWKIREDCIAALGQ